MNSYTIGIDVGGSHISGALLSHENEGGPLRTVRCTIDSHASGAEIINATRECVEALLEGGHPVMAAGVAFPGPFDYVKGVSRISGVGNKFERTFGLHLKAAMEDAFRERISFSFANDAHCYAAGCYHHLHPGDAHCIFLTLGTGFGSAFYAEGQLLYSHPRIPTNAAFYNELFKEGIADDYFSTRWFLRAFEILTGKKVSSVKHLVENYPQEAVQVFDEFADNLCAFLIPWIQRFSCEVLVIGGSIAKASHLFAPKLQQQLSLHHCNTRLIFTDDTEQMIINGAGMIASASTNISMDLMHFRKTNQPLLPVSKPVATGYEIFPSFHSNETIYTGYDTLATHVAQHKCVVIDGYVGVLWESFRSQLGAQLQRMGITAYWYDISACMKPAVVIDDMLRNSLNGDDPVFGKKFDGALTDFFEEEKLAKLAPDESAGINIVYGTGAALSGWKGLLVYLDIPKNEIQYRMRAASITNLGAIAATDPVQMYKRYYFADWPVLNEHKAALLPVIDIIVDEQRVTAITWMHGKAFRNTLDAMLQQPFRARPWFEAGIWGGHWMKQHLSGLAPDSVNYAWSFELITPENGIVLEAGGFLLEASFDFLLYRNNQQLLGKAAPRFGNEFPIRFDFLDTFDGGNLSIQCHPRTEYIREHFGENFTQDETYYILDCEPEAVVYLGFQDNIDPQQFRQALEDAQERSIELPAEKYVQVHSAKKHDLFLIPNGTVHASGKNNLVLEISSTPYIFTFKMYDWLRPGLDGKPRPINIEHAFNNLYFDRKGDEVKTALISQPRVVQQWEQGRQLQLPTHREHFYTVDRYEFSGSVEITTDGQCHICMLIEGGEVTVTTPDSTLIFHYAETFVVPASVLSYTVHYRHPGRAFLVTAYVKDECC
ncbi:MAG TPA: ROK family protein [Chitinophaga sp.]|uniref:ROK family protein n=1 Tax=Chitinophaga sp. TaxID=1869181 RepID=UPI002CBA975C|nr:ROK family protein [Chitinophaga sp.]HVI44258.1 ROK family protein [Chitinophaga sp.]